MSQGKTPIDPESQAMWNELLGRDVRSARHPLPPEVHACCEILKQAMREGLEHCTIYDRAGVPLFMIELNHCLHCGRPLK